MVRARRRRCDRLERSSKPRVLACLQAGADAAGCTDRVTSGRSRSTPTCATTCRWSTSTPPTPARSAATRRRRATRSRSWAAPTWATSATSVPCDPPDDRVAPPHVLDPHARVRRPTPRAEPRRRRRARRGQGDGHDGRRPLARTGARRGRRPLRPAPAADRGRLSASAASRRASRAIRGGTRTTFYSRRS